MNISLPQHIWYGNTTLDIQLPPAWETGLFPMVGAEKKPMTAEQMAQAVGRPINSPSLRDLARGKKTAVIIFDDMTRPTRAFEIAPIIVDELVGGGMDEEEIVFLCALGTHGALTQNEFRKKLGNDIPQKFRVLNHNIYENCVSVGTTSRGTNLMVNREAAEADLRIAIGCVTPHPQAGFSGGGKIILPGISHIDSIAHYHLDVEAMDRESTGMARFEQNILSQEIQEAAKLARLDFMVNVVVNSRGYTTDLFAGELTAAHAAAIELAETHYATEPSPVGQHDVVIANAFVKANEMPIALLAGMLGLKNFAGTVVIIADSPEGQVIHYLLGRWGRNYGGRQYPVAEIPASVRLIIMAPHFDKTFGDWFANPNVITWTRDWDQTLALLEKEFGPGTKAAVVPNATMQYYRMS
jgi:nickel-dependent lactate racemase